jgi:hypothetical protein
VGALHGMLNAEGLCNIFNDLFGGVIYASRAFITYLPIQSIFLTMLYHLYGIKTFVIFLPIDIPMHGRFDMKYLTFKGLSFYSSETLLVF